ncbi:hypothetical protein [Methylocaldum gracile]|jgi:HD-GYP domain-containing protein (c-di-GMP phosphodiesterase class II)|uniref:hypothetical protein n=1 Tax=unclassified Methylocaldum TaxID=2622260 RepID=UPI00105E2038
MTSTSERLRTAQSQFNEFAESVVYPAIGLSDSEEEELGFSEIAKRIEDVNVRQQYRGLAIELLDANIKHYQADATAIVVPSHSNVLVVVSTLAVAALALHFRDAVVALISAALWYWFAAETSRRSYEQKIQQAKKHNENVAEWTDALNGWRKERDELFYI